MHLPRSSPAPERSRCACDHARLKCRAVRLSIVIPVYNEAATVGALIDRVRERDKKIFTPNMSAFDGQ